VKCGLNKNADNTVIKREEKEEEERKEKEREREKEGSNIHQSHTLIIS
jgi:hypothetical protein